MSIYPPSHPDVPFYVPQTPSELSDHLMGMVGAAPSFKNSDPRKWRDSTHTEYLTATMGLENVRKKIGEERFEILTQMLAKTRATFEACAADLPEQNPQIAEACLMLQDMIEILMKRTKKSTTT